MNKPILLWKYQNLTNAFTLRVGDIRYIGLIRTDRKGESYWKFKEFIQKDNSDNNSNSSSPALNKGLEKDYGPSINHSEGSDHQS